MDPVSSLIKHMLSPHPAHVKTSPATFVGGVSPQAAGWGGDPLVLHFRLTRFKDSEADFFPREDEKGSILRGGVPKLFKFDT